MSKARCRSVLCAALATILVAMTLSACATPKEINGRRVKATRWVNGQVVYVLEGDMELMQRAIKQTQEATKGVVIAPVGKAQKPAGAATKQSDPAE